MGLKLSVFRLGRTVLLLKRSGMRFKTLFFLTSLRIGKTKQCQTLACRMLQGRDGSSTGAVAVQISLKSGRLMNSPVLPCLCNYSPTEKTHTFQLLPVQFFKLLLSKLRYFLMRFHMCWLNSAVIRIVIKWKHD